MDIQPAPINAIQDEIIQTFAVFADNREAMLHYLMELGDQMTPLADTYKTEKYRIPGCMSAVWLVHTLEKDRLVWEADSNTAITKGLISLLIRVLSGQTLSTIAHSELYFIEGIGMRQVIGSQRSSGLASMLKQMRLTALTYQQQLSDTQPVSAAPTAAPGESLQDQVVQAIKQVYDPELPVNIYELGLIYAIHVYPLNNVHIVMTLTSPSCPAAEMIPSQVESNVRALPDVNEVHVELTFDPPYTTDRMSEEAKLALGFL